MDKNVVILAAQDDEGHFQLTQKNLRRSGIWNEVIRFTDGRELLDFLFMKGPGPKRKSKTKYLLLLDLRLPAVGGRDVLKRIKENAELGKIPVVILTMTDDPQEVTLCYSLGCSMFITKPVDYDSFVDAVQKIPDIQFCFAAIVLIDLYFCLAIIVIVKAIKNFLNNVLRISF